VTIHLTQTSTPDDSPTMTPMALRSSVTLASIFWLRLLGLFLVMPVFALEARKYPGGDDPALIGLAMGIYGLTQGLLQIPFGMASDRWGRKRVILFGLVVFAMGSLYAGCADSLWELLLGRALQGAGAVSAAVTALLADQTRDVVRTKALALVSAGMGLMFALSLVVAPLLVAYIGLAGLFFLTAVLAVMGMAVVVWAVPPAPAILKEAGCGALRQVLTNLALLRLNLGVFVLNAVQLAMWVVVPALLVQAGWVKDDHWQIYLPAVLGSFGVMGGVFPLERRGYWRAVFLSAIALLALVQLALFWVSSGSPSITWLAGLLFAFFCGFNVLETTQLSMVSRIASASSRGAAMGIYNTLQSLGFFAGGWMGGRLVKGYGTQGLFLTCAALMLVWLVVAWPMVAPRRAPCSANTP
jgi:MFS family permease